MSIRRTKSATLERLLDAVNRPVYVLDADQRLAFCNDECLRWLRAQWPDLEGRVCSYYSGPDASGPDAVAAGLSPPPLVLAGETVGGIVVRCHPDGEVRRQAQFFPIGSPPDALVLAVLESEDLSGMPPPQPSSEGDEAATLHQRLRDFHRQCLASQGCQRLVGESLAMRRVRAQVGVAAGCGASVLVVGPAGSGRRRVASAIHGGETAESAGMLIPVDCAILTAESLASTVGAMTGRLAGDDRTARHTLLLTDVDTLGPDAQERLLAMLCGRQLPVRLISTSRQTLDDAAQNGTFRPDLAVLLATIVIPLPPLCERREDIPLTAQQLLEDLNLRGPRQLGGFTPDALDRLDGYSWPGNLDELAAVVAKAYRQAEGPLVTVRDLPEQIHLAAADSARPKRREDPIVLDQFLARIERELIQRALARAKGNKARAARLLGLTRPRLYRRMVQLKLITE